MDEPIVTFGLLMGTEVENEKDAGTSGIGTEALLIFCSTGESEEGNIDVTPRMTDLALKGFRPVVITRGDPTGHPGDDCICFSTQICSAGEPCESAQTRVLGEPNVDADDGEQDINNFPLHDLTEKDSDGMK